MLEPGTTLDLDVDASFEHGVLVDTGSVVVDGQPVKPAEMAYVEPGRRTLALEALEASRIVLLGGPPFGEQIVMWWNFVGRTHDEVVAFRREWQEQITRAERWWATARTSPTGGSAWCSATTCPPSRPHRSRPPASSPAADSLLAGRGRRASACHETRDRHRVS